MRIAICGPVQIDALSTWLDPKGADARAPRGLGGISVTHVATTLLDRGHELAIATLDYEVDGEVHLSGPRLSVRIGPYRRRGRARDAFRIERSFLEQALRRERPDVVHAHWTYEYALGALAAGTPTLVTVRDWAPAILALHPHPYRLMRLLMALRTFVEASHFTAVSPYIEQRLRRWRVGDVTLVPNGIPDAYFAGTRGSDEGDDPVTVAVNNGFGRRKNVHTLLRAWPRISEQVPGARLRLVGLGYEPHGPAHLWARERGLAEGVEFYGPVGQAQVMRILADAALLIHAAREESFGLVLIEAMAVGTPVIGGATSGAVPWVLDGGNAGLLTDIESPRAIADAAAALLSEPARREAVASRGRTRAWQMFRMSAVAARYVEEYERVIRGGHETLGPRG
jgi:L-malate glycosyltransferase